MLKADTKSQRILWRGEYKNSKILFYAWGLIEQNTLLWPKLRIFVRLHKICFNKKYSWVKKPSFASPVLMCGTINLYVNILTLYWSVYRAMSLRLVCETNCLTILRSQQDLRSLDKDNECLAFYITVDSLKNRILLLLCCNFCLC